MPLCHNKQRLEFKAFVVWPVSFNIVISLYVDNFIGAGYHIDRRIIVSAIAQNYQPAMYSLKD